MKRWLVVIALLLSPANAPGIEVAGVDVPETVAIGNRPLQLNGCGVRKKFFIKVYVGAFYATRPVSSLAEAVGDGGDQLIRMTFLYRKVDREKIVGAFAEGFAENTPELVGTGPVREFLALFTGDFFEGDVVDLQIRGSDTVQVRHNGAVLGTVVSPALARGILAVYLGGDPADEDLRAGMLGKQG